ncbi:MAG: CPBP family intramembrane metalloprotease [Oscillospiraceae bacterium]|nr:CPBP family intramembrane metalloprotease [Oscillospiraceae bacterium]
MIENKKTLNSKQLIYLLVFVILFLVNKFLVLSPQLSLWTDIARHSILALASPFVFRELYAASLMHWKKSIIKAVLLLLAIYLLVMAAETIASLPLYLLSPSYLSSNENAVSRVLDILDNKYLWIVVIGILGPITEEIIFRGILVGKLKQKYPAVLCVIGSSALFAICHMHAFSVEEFLYNLPHFFGAIVLSVSYLKTDNFSLCMLCHIMNNLPLAIDMCLSA